MNMTEKELLTVGQSQLYQLEKLREQKLFTLDEIDDLIPGFFHFSYQHNLNLSFLGKGMREQMQISMETLIDMENEFFETYIHEDTRSAVYTFFKRFYKQNDTSKIYTSFQKIRLSPDSDHYEWYLTILKVNKKEGALTGISNKVKDLEPLVRKFEQVVESNEFMKKHFREFASLTKQETEVLRLIALGDRRHIIADKLSISNHTLDTHRKNIRKKLNVNSTAAMIQYARAFDLI